MEYKYIKENNREILKKNNIVIFEKKGDEYFQHDYDNQEKKTREEIINIFGKYIENIHDKESSSFDDYELDVLNTENEYVEKPYKPSDVKYERKQLTCEQLFNQMTGYNGEEEPSIILDPDFQRKSVWKGKEETLFIESILLNIPIPSIYVNETKDKKLLVADGRQRLTAIQRFMQNKFRLKGTEYGLGKYEGKYFKKKGEDSLSPEEIRHLRLFSIDVNIISKETPDQVKLDIFGRLNSRGIKLNSQELRNSIMSKKIRESFVEIENEEIVKKVINNYVNTNRYSHYELYLRYFAFNNYLDNKYIEYIDKLGHIQPLEYRGNGKGYLDEYMVYLNQNEITEEMKEEFYSTLEKVDIAFGEFAFRREIITKEKDGKEKISKSRINTLLFTVLMNKYNKINLEKAEEIGNINKKFQVFIKDKLGEYISTATNNIPNIESTKREVSIFLKDIYGE